MNARSLALLLALAAAATPALAQEDISKVNGSITATSGQRYGDLDTVNGSIRVDDGVETGDIETVNGTIKVGEGARTGGIATVNGGVRLAGGVIARGNVTTVNGSIFADRRSRIEGRVETVNGGIGLVETQLAGDIETINGDVTVGVGSVVNGGIQIKKPSFSISFTPNRKPRVIIGPNAVVKGPLQFERDVLLYVHRSATTGPVSGATPVPFDTDTAPEN